jgi:hypothetical protein
VEVFYITAAFYLTRRQQLKACDERACVTSRERVQQIHCLFGAPLRAIHVATRTVRLYALAHVH